MKTILKGTILLISLIMLSCGGKDKEKREDGFSVQRKKAETERPVATNAANEVKASERIDLTTKGIGPIKSIEIPAEIDQAMAAKGKEVYEQMCLACHRVGKKFIGPAPNGVLDRRTPE